eukprot:5807216-Pyramimonas_sp.AAC.1
MGSVPPMGRRCCGSVLRIRADPSGSFADPSGSFADLLRIRADGRKTDPQQRLPIGGTEPIKYILCVRGTHFRTHFRHISPYPSCLAAFHIFRRRRNRFLGARRPQSDIWTLISKPPFYVPSS